jgi:hypothetical protein
LGGRGGEGAQKKGGKNNAQKFWWRKSCISNSVAKKVHEKDQSGGKQTNYAHCKGFSSKKPFYLTLLLAK